MTRIALLAAIAALAVAGCGGDDDSSSNEPAPAPAETQASTGSASSGGTVSIDMKNIQFAPKTQTVSVGQKVVWTNEDTVDHNVTAEEGADFESDDFGKGGTFEFTAEKAGTIKYTCTLHPGMDGTLTVTG